MRIRLALAWTVAAVGALAPAASTSGDPRQVFGRSAEGRPLRVLAAGEPRDARRVLVFGCIHGTECAGMAVTRVLAAGSPPRGAAIWLVHNLNPDGFVAGVRQNGRGVDLNRNFPSGWRPIGRRWDPQYSGPKPLSEPETRAARRLILAVRPHVTIWFHQPTTLVRAWGPSIPAARRYARVSGLPFRRLPWLAGTAPNWQNRRFPGTASFVVELPPGPLTRAAARRHAAAVAALLARGRETRRPRGT